jgi:hypothetical protein
MGRVNLAGGIACVGVWVATVHALAAPQSVIEATTLISQSYAINAKCNLLAEAEREELMDFLARAEIALAEQASVKIARDAINKGKSLGQAVSCDDSARQLVVSTLALARGAETQIELQEAKIEPAEKEPPPVQAAAAPLTQPVALAVVQQDPVPKKPKKALAQPPKEKVQAQRQKKKAAPSLAQYAGVAEKYYVELKCRSMSGPAVKRLYANVLSNHRKAVAENGAAPVKAMLRAAEARAGAARCG